MAPLYLYNTLNRRKEEFKPLNPPKVGMYVCGMTVYDYCHLGHARALINFDVLYRYLKYKGYQVNYVRNFTDVDDKIIKRAQEEKIPWNEVAQKYIQAFNEDAEALKIEKPTEEPKATDNINEIIKIIQGLIDRGYAYQAGQDIFYSVRKKSDYGKLSGKKIDELESGARIEIHEEKKDPLDFALWKASQPGPKGAPFGGEPSWESPWGPGRPGWHIECSAMSMRYLGTPFDIHGGGRDLSFPHHENEIAQSEAFSGKPFARYWVHNGFVNINAQKMSKSLKNFIKIRDLLKEYHPEVIRLFVLSAHYRSPLDYSEGGIQSIKQSLDRWYTTMARVSEQFKFSKKDQFSAEEMKLSQRLDNFLREFEKGMDDDLNTAKVIGFIFDISREWNRLLDAELSVCSSLCQKFIEIISKISQVLGVFGENPSFYLEAQKENKLQKSQLTSQEINSLIKQRNEARREKKWSEADAIRQKLLQNGIKIKDNSDGTTSWSV